nr:pentapeptide repeat-containing protein [Neobacillus sp. Marseille-Q6967]
MSNLVKINDSVVNDLSADCENCFGLCCVALPYAKSADFPINKDAGTPCSNLQSNYRCGIHKNLRQKGFRGCAVYECFGAGQKVSQVMFSGNDWREYPSIKKDMFDVFPMIQQLHEMLFYLREALGLNDTQPIHKELQGVFDKTEKLTKLSTEEIFKLDVAAHRAEVNELLLQTSELVRAKVSNRKNNTRKSSDFIGAKLKGTDLRGTNLRGCLLIAADLRNADMRVTDFIGADLRDANLSGADLRGSIFLTQAQINSANGDIHTKLPASIKRPDHWI